jgi:hypothetical protein
MIKIGLVCVPEIEIIGHSLFDNFYKALKNYVNSEIVFVKSVNDLVDLNALIIVDEHLSFNIDIWKKPEFINRINELNLSTIVFNFEKVYNSSYTWNEDHQNNLLQIKNLHQFISDVDDAKILNKSYVNRQFLSRSTVLVPPITEKKDEILFIGQIYPDYTTRVTLLKDLEEANCGVKIIKSQRKYTYTEYLNILNEHKYILNPLGMGKFLNLRFYEALELGCTVIQQYTDSMLEWYPELNRPDVIKFKDVADFLTLDFKTTPGKNIYLEDYFNEINLKSLFN